MSLSPAAVSPITTQIKCRVEIPKSFVILEDIVQHTLSNMHSIQESILFWQSSALRTNSQKVYFMIFQRGPSAFVETTCQTLAKLGSNGSPVQDLLDSASSMFSTKLAILTRMQHCLASFLAEVYNEADKHRAVLIRRSEKSLHSLFVGLNNIFSNLVVELRNAGEPGAILSNHDDNSFELLFQRLPEADVQSSAAISLIYDNLQKLDNFLSSQVSSIRYLANTLQQSKSAGKQDIQLTEDPLSKCGNISFFLHERYEKEPTHPIQTISLEELACLMINQTEKLVQDLEEAMQGFEQVLRVQQITLAFGRWLLLSVLLVPARVVHGQVTERRGSIAQHKRRQLLFGVEEMLTEFQQCMANGMEEEAHCKLGLLLYSIYRFYRGVESQYSKETVEWLWMKEYIFDLADPQIGVEDKRDILLRVKNYKCLSPPSRLCRF